MHTCVLRVLRNISLVIVFVLSLASCGSGDSGGSGGGGDAYSVSPTSITFVGTQGGTTPPAQNANVTVNSGTVYGGVTYSGQAVSNATFQVTGGATGQVTIFPVAPTMSPGTYTGTVVVSGYTCAACTSQVAGSPKTINVTYNVSAQPTLSTSAASLSFSRAETSALPSAQNLTLSYSGGAASWSSSINYVSGSGWLTVTPASGSTLPASMSVAVTAPLSIGTYQANIVLSAAGLTTSIPVTYTVTDGVAVTPTSLSFSAAEGTVPANQNLNIGFTGTGNAPAWTASVAYVSGSGWLNLSSTSGTGMPANISVGATALAAGTYQANISIQYTTVSGTYSRTIPVTYTTTPIAQNISFSPANLSFSAVEGLAPASQNLNINYPGTASVPWTASVGYSSGSGWLNLSPSSGTTLPATIAVTPAAIGAGTYGATITIQYTTPSGTFTKAIPVTYTTSNAWVTTPAQLSFAITGASTSASLTQTVAIGDNYGGTSNIAWTASSNVNWLSLSPASGTTTGSNLLTVSLVAAQLALLPNGATSGTITLTPSTSGVSVRTIPVALTMNVPQVNFVSPYVAVAGSSDEVVVRGSGFQPFGSQGVKFGTNDAASFTVVSDTEIRATPPALSAGSYPVQISNALGLNRSRAKLVVAAPPSFAYAALPTSLVQSRIIYDAERAAVYTNNQSAQYGGPAGVPRIERHRWSGTSWTTDSILLAGVPWDIALTPDGAELIAVDASTLYHIDLATWSITHQIDITSFAYPYNTSGFYRLAMGNDGNALVYVGSSWVTPFQYNVLTRTFVAVPGFTNGLYGSIAPVSSIDGSRILVGQNGITGPLKLYYFDASLSQFVQALPNLTVNRMSYDRTGSNSIIDGAVFNRQFQAQGSTLQSLSVISPDGTRAYGVILGTTPAVRTYDLTSPDGAGGFNTIGSDITIPDSPGDFLVLGITPDGRTLFVSGYSKFIVQPLP